MHGWRCVCKTTRPRGLPTRTSSWRRRSRTSSTGSRPRKEGRSKARRRRIIASLTLSTTSYSCAGRTGLVVRDKPDMGHAWIDGRPVVLQAAISEAAKLLAACRAPVLAGLGTDIAGPRAVIALAQRLRGAVDHIHAGTILRDLAVTREAGMMVTTPNEARLRADVLLLIGPSLEKTAPQLVQWLGLAAGR